MRILLTGATGYIGKRLLPVLLDLGHEVICCVRDVNRFTPPDNNNGKIKLIQVDLLDKKTLSKIPKDIDAAYYLVHSMSVSAKYQKLEHSSAVNFKNYLNKTNVKHVIYLSGIVNETILSEHLSSRKNVEDELSKGNYEYTVLRAGIIVGSGSASFEIIRDLVEKLPIMVTPKWLNTKCQPIGVSDVILFLTRSLLNEKLYGINFDIGGPEVLTYKEMLLEFAKVRNLKRKIFIVPVMTPRLSSYWLYFVTSTSYNLAIALVDSMKIEVICRNDDLNKILNIEPLNYRESLLRAFNRIDNKVIISSWKDAYASSAISSKISDYAEVPSFGCFEEKKVKTINDRERCINKIWSIGGRNGWYYANTLWRLRGFIYKLAGGVGLRRGRTNDNNINVGDALDFWRVIYADKEEGRLLLFAEMKLPGEAWLEFKIVGDELLQTATFRPLGLTGRLYWYTFLPFHEFIFQGMIDNIVSEN